MRDAVRLPLKFDPAGLQADVAALAREDWLLHFNTQYFDGEWSGVAFRAQQGTATTLFSGPNSGAFSDTDFVARCPHVREVIAGFHCPLKSVRFLKLAAGSVIREHRDYGLGYDEGEVRIHVPVVTNPGVEFILNNRRIVMAGGECWYLDLGLPHRVANRGPSERIHLVLDCEVNDWLRSLLAEAGAFNPEPVQELHTGAFERFRGIVLSDPALFDQLRAASGREEFIGLAMQLGPAHGCHFASEDIDAAMRAARRAWIERTL